MLAEIMGVRTIAIEEIGIDQEGTGDYEADVATDKRQLSLNNQFLLQGNVFL